MPHARLLKYWRNTIRDRRLEFFAKAPTPQASASSPDCAVVPHSVSAVFEPGVRTYAFKTAAERDTFVQTYRTAEVCENPWP